MILATAIPSLLILPLIIVSSVAYHYYKAHKKDFSLNDNPQVMYEEVTYSMVNSAANVDLKTLKMKGNIAYGMRSMNVMPKKKPNPGTQ